MAPPTRDEGARPIPIANGGRSTSSAGIAGPSSVAASRSLSSSLMTVPQSLARSANRGAPPTKRRPSAAANRRASSTAGSVGMMKTLSTAAHEDLEGSDDAFEPEAGPSRSGAGSSSRRDVYQCEICRKYYKHGACMTKHRWQHTDFWKDASKLMGSKHQTVQMLEAAAILLHPTSLPTERALWPAAVSPPESGLIGSNTLNSETLRQLQAQRSVGSPPAGMFAQLALAPEPKRPLRSEMVVDSDDALGDDDAMELDAGEMFDFEHESGGSGLQLHVGGRGSVRSASTAPTTVDRSSAGDGSGGEEPPMSPKARPDSSMAVLDPSFAARAAKQPATALGISAPALGFFQPRSLGQAATISYGNHFS